MDSSIQISPEIELSDILSRSSRLEKLHSFRFNLSIASVLNRTRNISQGYVDFRSGTLLLAREGKKMGVDLLQARDDLECMEVPEVREDHYTSFQDRINRTYQDVIVKSVRNVQDSTEKMNENFLFNYFQQINSKSASSTESSIIPIFNLDSSLTKVYGDVKYELTPKLAFYTNLLPEFQNNMAYVIANAIYASDIKLYNDKMRCYYSDTFDLISHIANNPLNSASEFLESQKRRFIEREVRSNLRSADRGGTFGFVPTIKGYLNIQKSPHRNSPWAIIYFAIRCGAFEEANEYAKTAPIDADVKTAIECFTTRTPITGHLLQTLIAYLNSEFNSPQYDKFKVLTLSILTNKRKAINDGKVNIEDWLWFELQFNHNINELVEKLKSEHQFNEPHLQGQILLITGSYSEAARWFLDQKEDTKDNLHVVLAMHVAGLIDSSIILRPLINHAIDIFKASHEAAVRYLGLIRDKNNLVEALTEFVIKADRGYRIFEIDQNEICKSEQGNELSLSTLSSNRISPIEAVVLPEIIKEVLQRASYEARRRDMYELTIKLYELSHNYGAILHYDCLILKNVIENHVSAKQYINIIQHHYALLLESSDEIDVSSLRIMYLLIKLANACEFERLNMYDRAVNEFEETQLFPTSKELASSKFEQLMSMRNDILFQVIPVVILSALRCYYNMHFEEIQAEKRSHNHISQKDQIKIRCKALEEFAQNLDLSNSVQSQIIRLSRQLS